MVTCGFDIVINGERYPKMFLQPFSKGSCRLPYVFLVTLQPIALISVYYPTFLCGCCPCPLGTLRDFWLYYLFWNGLGFPFYLNCFWNFHLIPLNREPPYGSCHGLLLLLVLLVFLWVCVVLYLWLLLILSLLRVWFGYLYFCKGPLYMFLSLMQYLLVGTNSPCPVCKSVEYTRLWWLFQWRF